MEFVLTFDDPKATQLAATGGKGSSLSRLAVAGFPVPAGFVVTTDAYSRFIDENDLQPQLLATLSATDFTDPNAVEEASAKIRNMITGASVPAFLADEVTAAYRDLAVDFVAVRSSGTAEDLAEASFAGQHESYLDIRGADDVLDAVRHCWASLWTARACAYRQQKGFDHSEVRLAVVVQTMVASQISGVLFTANPLTTAVDEYVVNASWGLGEGIVSGMLTPDQFTLDRGTLAVKQRGLGSKAVQVVRNPQGPGVVHEDVPIPDRERFCISDSQLAELGNLGARVTEYYGGWPQDIEWAVANGELFLLQSRDVTGVDLSWDEDIDDDLSTRPQFAPEAILTRAFADEAWPGRKTPLFYSMRIEICDRMLTRLLDNWQLPDTGRFMKYHKGEVYWNPQLTYDLMARDQHKLLHDAALTLWVPPSWGKRLEDEPGASWLRILKVYARIKVKDPKLGLYAGFDEVNRRLETEAESKLGLSPERLRQLSDRELLRHFDEIMQRQEDWYVHLWTWMFLYGQWAFGAFSWMLKNWYTGSNQMIFADLITGLPRHTCALKENLALWNLAEQIRHSDELSALFEEKRDGEFFSSCAEFETGREFLTNYEEFLRVYGHRGAAERDGWYPRRAEDPSIDYQHLQVLLSGAGDVVPGATEERLIARREEAAAEVIDCIRKQPMSALKIEIFKAVHDFMLKFYMLRDDERFHSDAGAFAKKKVLVEIGRRVGNRSSVIQRDDDFWYLTKTELLGLLHGATGSERLLRAKIESRRRNCEELETGVRRPLYIHGDSTVATGVDEEGTSAHEEGLLRGVPTSRGTHVGIARIVPFQKDIGRVKKGEILVCFATDPGWTSVFMVAGAAIFETGGILAHCACISREYGIPAVQVIDATKLIEDGSTIEVNGDTGEIRILARPGEQLQPA